MLRHEEEKARCMLSGRESTHTNLCTRPHSDSSPWACPLKVLFGVAKLLAVCCLLFAACCALSSTCFVCPIFYLFCVAYLLSSGLEGRW
jgi:hypothetical protein